MTDHNNSSPAGDDSWSEFVSEHAEDLQDVERSRTGRKFSRHVEREQKKAMLSVNDLKEDSFVGGNGPRDHTGASWLDTDDIMDRHGAGFTPPNPDLRGGTTTTRLVCGILLVVGVVGIILASLFPAHTGWIGLVSAILIMVGAGGLMLTRSPNPHLPDHEDDDYTGDNGARV
ncbi:MAG: DUF308 domain-containing protein [Bifidobacterium sp.]|nr:DUF308 domain-containing protein [Bifidobacterium sp.]